MSDLIERLRKMAATHERGFPVTILYSEISQALDIEAADRITALEKENAELRAALKPFARIADMEEHQEAAASVMVNVSRCRDARTALRDAGGSNDRP